MSKAHNREHRERLERELAARDAVAATLTRAAIRELRQGIAISRQLAQLETRKVRA